MTAWVSQYQKGKTSLDLNEAKNDGLFGCSGISWTIYVDNLKQKCIDATQIWKTAGKTRSGEINATH